MMNVANAQAGFTSHWANWYTQSDFSIMKSMGLKSAFHLDNLKLTLN